MNKTQKTVIMVISIITLILLIFIANKGGLFAIDNFSTLALSNPDFTSNDPTIGGKAWLLTVSQNGAGQSAYGSFTARDPNGEYSDTFTLTTSLDKNYASYPIFNTGQRIYRYEYTTTTYNPLGSMGGCNPEVWPNYYHPGFPSITAYCYKTTSDGLYGTVGSANINFQSTINVVGRQGSDSCTISNKGATSCVTNNGNAQVSWGGSLVSGQAPPQPTDQNIIAIYDTNKGGWKIADKAKYDSWKAKYDNVINCLSSTQSTFCFIEANNLLEQLFSGKQFTSTGGDVATTEGAQSNGQVIMNLPTQIQFPVLTFRIKADFIGIHIPVGKPLIVSTSSDKFQTGQTGTIAITVKNIGTGIGSFDVSSSCGNGFSQSGNTLRISSLGIGSSQTVYLPITANCASQEISGACTITVTDVNNPSNIDTKSTSVICAPIAICTQGQKRIVENSIQQCQSNVWVIISSCAPNEIAKYVGTTPQCVSSGSGTGSGSGSGSTGENDTCQWYETSYTEQTKDYGFLYWRYLFGNPIINTTQVCKISPTIYIAGLIIVIVLLIFGITFLGKSGANVNGIILLIAGAATFIFRPKASDCNWYNLICMGTNTALSLVFMSLALILFLLGVFLLFRGKKKK